MFARPIHYQNRFFRYLITLHPQKYVNLILVLIGLSADLIALGTFFGAIHTPETGSNFYVNSREFLVWVLIAIVYSIGFINGMIRRRWRKLYGDTRADHSVLNLFAKMSSPFLFKEEKEKVDIQFRNFQRDFSFLYLAMFIVTLLFSRAVTATESSTGITPSPWGDFIIVVLLTIPLTVMMMVITSMFDFARSMFLGDQGPEVHENNSNSCGHDKVWLGFPINHSGNEFRWTSLPASKQYFVFGVVTLGEPS